MAVTFTELIYIVVSHVMMTASCLQNLKLESGPGAARRVAEGCSLGGWQTEWKTAAAITRSATMNPA